MNKRIVGAFLLVLLLSTIISLFFFDIYSSGIKKSLTEDSEVYHNNYVEYLLGMSEEKRPPTENDKLKGYIYNKDSVYILFESREFGENDFGRTLHWKIGEVKPKGDDEYLE